MKGYYRHILLASAVIMAAAACTKHTEYDTPETDNIIQLSATESGTTKALLNNGSFSATGNRIKVYDYVTSDGGTSKYLDTYAGPDVTSSSPLHVPGTTWPFTDEIDGTEADVKQWTPGTHKFFGWLAKDVSSGMDLTPEGLFGDSFSFDDETQTLTIPSTTMTASTPQFDFMYSNIFTTEPINEPVDLEFSHLFTAYYFSFTNDSAEQLYLESVSLNAKTSASATLNFSGSSPVANISFQGTQAPIEKTYYTYVEAGKTIDVLLTGAVIDSPTDIPDDSYRLVWPQDLSDASVNIVFTAKVTPIIYSYNAKGGPYNVDEAVSVGAGNGDYNLVGDHYEYAGKGKGSYNVTFKHDARGVYIESIGDPEDLDVSKSIPLASVTSDGEWIGGKKYNYNLSFSNDFVDLELVVMKWDGGHGGNISFE